MPDRLLDALGVDPAQRRHYRILPHNEGWAIVDHLGVVYTRPDRESAERKLAEMEAAPLARRTPDAELREELARISQRQERIIEHQGRMSDVLDTFAQALGELPPTDHVKYGPTLRFVVDSFRDELADLGGS